jgi:hypothetical protein
MHKAAVAAGHKARQQDRLEDPAEKGDGVEVGGTRPCPARVAIRAGDGAVCERADAAIGEGDREAQGGEGWAGGLAVRMGLAVDVPGDGPELWGEGWAGSRVWPLLVAERPGEGREGLAGDKAGGARGEPRGAVFGQTATWDDGVEVGRIREWPAPGMQESGKAGALRTEEPLGFGEAFESSGRGVAQGLVGEVLR